MQNIGTSNTLAHAHALASDNPDNRLNTYSPYSASSNIQEVKIYKLSNNEANKQQLMADVLDLSEKLIDELFNCYNTSSNNNNTNNVLLFLPIADFAWKLVNRLKIDINNIVVSLMLLYKLKKKHPKCEGEYGSGHRLFLASLIISNKILSDNSLKNIYFVNVFKRIFSLKEINRMEFELLYFLDFDLFICPDTYFQFLIWLDYSLHIELVNVNCLDSFRSRLFDSVIADFTKANNTNNNGVKNKLKFSPDWIPSKHYLNSNNNIPKNPFVSQDSEFEFLQKCHSIAFSDDLSRDRNRDTFNIDSTISESLDNALSNTKPKHAPIIKK